MGYMRKIEYCTVSQIHKQLHDRRIYIYGCGTDGKELINQIKDLNLIGFIDTYKEGDIANYPCVKLKKYHHHCGDFIIIASSMYYQSMIDNLDDLGLTIGKDYAVYDKDFFFHKNESIEKIIKWNQEHFIPLKDANNRILIPFENIHDSSIMTYAYYSNYYADKYNAVIDCFIRRGGMIENTSPVIREIYESFGANIVNIKLDYDEELESESIFNSIWNSVDSVSDIKNIYIYGIHFGTTIIRDYLRYRTPHFDIRNDEIKNFVKDRINHIVFWYHRIMEYDYKIVLLWDGVHWEGYIRDIALNKGIPCYALHYTEMRKMFPDYYCLKMCEYYPMFWIGLSLKEKKSGIRWAEKFASETIKQWSITAKNHKEVVDNFIYRYGLTDNRIKLVIAPHIFDEDCYHCGEQIFDDDYYSWLCHLGGLSDQTDYVWFIKPHPAGGERDSHIIDKLTSKYKKLHLLPPELNAIDLKKMGIQFGLTVNGTIGEEYPLVGIQVINAGKNPHDRYGFNINPTSKQEYDDIIMHLNKYLSHKINIDELYEFYAIHRLFYDYEYFIPESFWNNTTIDLDEYELHRRRINKRPGTWKYDLILEELNESRHTENLKIVERMDARLDTMSYDKFYKKIYDKNNCNLLDKKIYDEINNKL